MLLSLILIAIIFFSSGYPYVQKAIDNKGTDHALADSMAAVMINAKNEGYATNQYAQYGYNPQTAPTYSATNYSYPAITQSYTITSSNQQIPGSAQQPEYDAMNYVTSALSTSMDTTPHYSVSSVQPQSMPTGTTYNQYSTPAAGNSPYQFSYGNVPSLSTQSTDTYSSYIPQGYGSPSVPATGINSMSYSTNAYNQQSHLNNYASQPLTGNNSYPYDNQSSSYGNMYGNFEQNANPLPQQYDYNTYNNYYVQSTNTGIPPCSMYTDAYSNNSYTYTQTDAVIYSDNCYTTSAPNIVPTTVSYISSQQTSGLQPLQTVAVKQTAETNSNIDLLAGLDFSVNQAPLIPQPTDAKVKEEKEVTVSKSETQINVTHKASPVQPSNKATNVKKCEINLLEVPKKDLLGNSETFKLFLVEVEKYEKFIDGLTTKTLNGPTTLDIKWKEIQDKQDIETQKRSISVARCYPMKNRSADILPYDSTRVELLSAKDDYINACHVRVCIKCIYFLLLQFDDF